MNYGVPQSRQRYIYLLTLKTENVKWEFPEEDSHIITLKEAIGGLPSLDPCLRDENEKLAKKLEETNKKFEDKKLKCDYYQKQANQTKSKLKETQAMYEDEQKKNQDLQKQKQQ